MTQQKSDSVMLSSNVRKMKFMQKGLTEEERLKLEKNEKQAITSEHWELDIPELGKESSRFEVFHGNHLCETYRHGRLSYGGFNKTIEKLMIELNQGDRTESDTTEYNNASVSDKEMTEWFASCSTLTGTIAKKFKTKQCDLEKKPERKGRKLSRLPVEEIPSKVSRKNVVHGERKFLRPNTASD